MTRSWNQKPFVAMKAFDTRETSSCPAEYPEDVLYDIWLGTRKTCSCLEREKERSIGFDRVCEKSDDGEDESQDCHDIGGIAPIVLNTFNGVRYCGKQGELGFKDL